jgi:mannose-6-phosphate isomerase-like protein (cupin superfamily)
VIGVVVDCVDLGAEMQFFRDHGFRINMISPADAPEFVVLERAGGEVELRRSDVDRPVTLRVVDEVDRRTAGANSGVTSPGGSQLVYAVRSTEVSIPPNRPELVVVDASEGSFGTGRAGMEYRDLLPGRWGGRFIASHIRLEDGGDVADWVHFHRVRFQMIFVAAGWVDVVYEDQGESFRMHVGDCVLQPPEIRHRVLRSSPGLEVIEIGCPAVHDTIADHELDLPNAVDASREFGGQRFVRHVAADAASSAWVDPAFDAVDTGIAAATDGLAGAVVVSKATTSARVSDDSPVTLVNDGEFALVVGLAGSSRLEIGERSIELAETTSVAIPPATSWTWRSGEAQHRALVVTLPGTAIRPQSVSDTH